MSISKIFANLITLNMSGFYILKKTLFKIKRYLNVKNINFAQ